MAQRSCNPDATEITPGFSDKPQPLVEPPSPVPASDMASIDKLRSSGAGDAVMAMAMTPSSSSSSSSTSGSVGIAAGSADLRPIPSPLVLSPSTPQPTSSSSRQSPVHQPRPRQHHSVKVDPPELPSPLSLTPSIPPSAAVNLYRHPIPHTINGNLQSVTGIPNSNTSISRSFASVPHARSSIAAAAFANAEAALNHVLLHDPSPSSSSAPAKPPTNRCFACRKRVGLLGFKCRCGDVFCATHRYSDRHNCSYDYKAAGRAAIAKENPVVLASKIVKI